MKGTAPTNAQALACVYALEGRAVVIMASRDRGGEHEVVIAFDLAGGNGWGIFFAWQVPDGEQVEAVQKIYPHRTTIGI